MVRYTVNNDDLRNTYLAVAAITVLLFVVLYLALAEPQLGSWELAIFILPWVVAAAYMLYSATDLYLWRYLSMLGLFRTPALDGSYHGKYWASEKDYASPNKVSVSISQTLSDIDVEMVTASEGRRKNRYEGVVASVIDQPYLSYLYYPFSSEEADESDELRTLHEGFCALEFDKDRYHVRGRYFTEEKGKISDGVMSMERVSAEEAAAGVEAPDLGPYALDRPVPKSDSATEAKSKKKRAKSATSYSESQLLEGRPEPVLEIYDELRRRILEIDDGIQVVPMKHHISFKGNSPFVDMQVQKTQIKVWLNLSIGELDDPREIARDVSDVKHWGSGEYEVVVKSGEDMDYLLMLIKQSYRRNNL